MQRARFAKPTLKCLDPLVFAVTSADTLVVAHDLRPYVLEFDVLK
jgi:hypothetical protein